MKFYVYVDWTKDEVPVPFYVGKGNLSRILRIMRNRKHSNVSSKHGIERRIVLETEDENEALELEKKLIVELNTFSFNAKLGSNFTLGGDGVSGYRHTAEAIEKNRLLHTGKTQAIETCEKRQNSLLSSDKVKRVQVEQYTLSGEFIQEYSSVCAAERALQKVGSATLISRCCRGKSASALGYVWKYVNDPGESRPRRRAICVPIKQLTLDGVVIAEHESIASAARNICKKSTPIRFCCDGKLTTAYGYRWQRIEKASEA